MPEAEGLINKMNKCNKFSPQHAYKRIQTLDITFGKKYLGSFRTLAFTRVFFAFHLGLRREGKGRARVRLSEK
jgi:hypothetical protein